MTMAAKGWQFTCCTNVPLVLETSSILVIKVSCGVLKNQSDLFFMQILKDEFSSQGYNVSTREAPNLLIKIGSLFDRTMKSVAPGLGKVSAISMNIWGFPKVVSAARSAVFQCNSPLKTGRTDSTADFWKNTNDSVYLNL